MSEADFCGMDAGEYYATKDFLDRERFYRKQEICLLYTSDAADE